jgi:hypothetical protein
MKGRFLLWLAVMLAAGCLRCSAQITPNPWVNIGPRGDVGLLNTHGRVRSIQIRQTPGDFQVFIGASAGGVWRALGSLGPVWTSLGDRLPNPSAAAIAVHPNNPDDILVGTGDWNHYDLGDGFYHTTDGGASWSKVPLVSIGHCFQILYPDPANPNLILAATDIGLLQTSTGVNGPWINFIPGIVTDLVLHPSNPSILYCAVWASGVWRTLDSGGHWNPMSPQSPAFDASKIGNAVLAICRTVPDNLAFTYENLDSNGKETGLVSNVWVTSTGGTNWSAATVPTDPHPEGPGQAFHALSLAIQPNDPQTIFLGANELWRSSNSGQSWTMIPKTIDYHQDHTRLVFSPVTGDDVLWICSDGGVFRWRLSESQSSSWNGASNALTSLSIMQQADMDATRDLRVIGNQDDGTAASSDAGSSWAPYSCCDVYSTVITQERPLPFPNNLPVYWFTMPEGSVTKQALGGVSQDVSYLINPITHSVIPVSPLFYNRFEDKVYGLESFSGVSALVSRMGSASGPGLWATEIAMPTGTRGLSGDRLNGKTLFVWGGPPGVLSVLKNSGGSWSVLRNAPIGISNTATNPVSAVFASTEWPAQSWAGLQTSTNFPQVFYSGDDWLTSSNLTGNLGTNGAIGNAWSLAVMPFNRQVIFLSTDKGVFATADGGLHWQPFQDGMPIVQCRVLRYVIDVTHNGNDKLLAATYGHGLYERLIPRPGLVYVDQGYVGLFPDGSFEHPLTTMGGGLATTPPGGMMALNGKTVYTAPATLNQRMTITAYETPAFLTH